MTTKPKNTVGLSDFTQSNDADFRSIARQSRIFELQEAARLAGQEKTKRQNQGVLGDIVDAGQMGALQAGAGMAETAHQITGSEFMGDAAQALNNKAESQIEQMSPEGQASIQKQFFSEDDNGDVGFGDAWTDPRAIALNLSTLTGQMVPQIAAGFGLGGLGAKVAGNVVSKAAVKHAASKGLTGDAALNYATNVTRAAFGTAGQSIAGAGMAGGMVGLAARDEVKAMTDQELDESNAFRQLYYQLEGQMPELDVGKRRDMATDMLADRVAATVQRDPKLIATNLVLDAAGGFFIDRLLRGVGTGSRLSNAGQQFVAQGVTEAGQGGMEQYALNSAMIDEQVDTNRGRMDGVAVNALNEGVMGGMFGAGVGSLRKGQPQQRPLPEPATLDGETDSSGDQASNQANTDDGMQPIDMAPVGDSESFITPPKMSLDDAVEAVQSERGQYRGVDDDIAIAERMGFDDEAVRLRAAKRNFEMAADFANEGDTASAKRFNERALKIYREVTQMGVPELQSAPGSTLPAEYVAVGEFLQRPAELPRGESGEIIDEMETLVPDVEEFQPTDPQLPSPEAVDAPYFTDQTDVPDVEYETGPQEQETVELGAEQPPLPEVEETDLAPLPEVENIDEIPYTPGDVARQPGISLEAEYPGEVVEYDAQSDSETMGDSIKDEIRKHKMPKGLDDGRLLRENFRNKLVDMRNSLVAGGGVSYIRDENDRITGRTQSINPVWFQHAPDNVRRIGVKNIQVSIDRALKGKSLGRGQARAVKYLLDHFTDERGRYASEHLKPERENVLKFRKVLRGELTPEEAGFVQTSPSNFQRSVGAQQTELSELVESDIFEESFDDSDLDASGMALAEVIQDAKEAKISDAVIVKAAEQFGDDPITFGIVIEELVERTRNGNEVTPASIEGFTTGGALEEESAEASEPAAGQQIGAEEQLLTSYTEEDLQQREIQNRRAEDTQKSDIPPEFVLAGSERDVDQLEARGQANLLNPPDPEQKPKTNTEAPALAGVSRSGPEVIRNFAGNPFKHRDAARIALKKNPGYEIVQVDGGFELHRSSNDIDEAAKAAALSPDNDIPEPTESQKEAGNYKKAHVKVHGMDITIENPKGSQRSGTDATGKPWSVTMQHHYGYLKRTKGADGDHVDVFIGPDPESEKIFIIYQVNANGTFDEHKVMLGFKSQADAVRGYKSNYEKGWKVGPVKAVTVSEFKEWLSGDTTKPADDQALAATSGSEGSAPAIDDFGEELKGARKHLNRRLLERADNLTDSDIAGSSLSKIWPKSEIDAIDDTQAAALHQAIRDEIPTKPRSGYKVRRWVDQVKQVLDLARLADSLGSEAMINQMKMKGGALKNVAARIEVLAGIDRSDWGRVGSVRAESGEYKPPNEDKMIPGSWFHVRVDGSRQSFYGASEVAEFIGDLRDMLASKPPAAKRLKMSVYTRRIDRSAYIAADADKERRPLREFKNSKDALKALNDEAVAAELEQEWEKIKARSNVSKKDVRGKTNSVREGVDLRNGKDVTPEQFTEAFGFRGVQFGNWVKQGDNGRDRQGMLNQAYDALMDLAEILGIPPKAISLNGELGLAFGARGSGWAAAHYEPGTKVINLTKTQGAGSLAHEWFHALDHYFQSQRQISGGSAYITKAPENYYQHKKSGTRLPAEDFERMMRGEKGRRGQRFRKQDFSIDDWEKVEGVRPKVADAFAAVVQALDTSPMLDRSRLIDKGKEDGYWSRIIERAARSFENYVIAKMADADKRNEYLANVISVDDFPREAGRYPYLLDSEMKPVAEAFDQLFDAVDTKETEKGVALFSYSGRVSDMAEALRSAGETGSTPEPAHSTVDQVKEWIAATEKMIGTKINVVQNKQDLPNEVIGRIIGADIHSFIRGFEGVYDTPTDQVYLIAGQIENQSDAIRVVLHEALGHAGVIKMLKAHEATGGAALADVLDTIFRQAGRDVIAREISEYNFDFNDQSERRTAVLEYIAHVAEKGKAMGRVRKVIAALRDFIRRVFPGLRWNETDTLALIEKGRVFLRRERSEEGGATLLSKAPGEYSVKRVATNFTEARQAANDFKGQALKNTETGLVATVSRNNLDKMLSRKAVSKSETAAAHSLAVANLDQLFERAVKGWSKSDRDGNTDIAAVHRFFTPVIKDGKASLVKMTVKEMVREDRNNPLYTVESVEFDERAPAASWVREIAEADGINPREIRSAEAVLSMAQAVEDYNSGQVTDRPLFRLSDAIANDDNLSERQKDFLDKIGPKSMTETAADRFREVTDRWRLKVRQGLTDRFAGLLELDKQLLNGDVTSEQNITQSAWVKARMSNAASGAVSAMMNTGRIYLDEKEGVVDVKEDTNGLVFSLNKLGSAAEVEKFMGWIAANRAEKLAAEGRENLFTSEEIAAGKELNTGVLPDGRNRQDVYDQVFSEFQQYRDDVLAIAEKSGVISSEAREMWRDEFYVPFYRLDEGNDDVSGPRVMGGLSRQQAYKKLKGGTQNLNDLLQNTIMNFHHLIDASMKNLAATQAMDNALALDAAEQTAEAARDKKQSTFILRNGQKVWYNIADPLVYQALTSLNHTGMNGTAMQIMRWFKRTFTNLTTSTPQFIVANMIRDSLSAIAVTDLKANAAGNVASGLKAFGVTDRTGLQRARLMASGGAFSFGHVYGEDADSIRYQIDGELRRASVVRDPKSLLRHGLKPIQAGWDRWQDVNNSFENANRMAAFQQAEEAGKGKLYAAHQARDLMDFSSIGAWPAVRFLIDVVPFLNARLQGLDKLYRSGVKPSAKVVAQMLGVGSVETTVSERKAAARFSAVVGALSVATMALFMHNNDDEDYRKAEDWLKDSYWWFRVPGTEHVVLIPKPFEVGAMATMAERLLQQFVDDKATGQLFRERMGHMLSSTFSFSPVPQVFQPAIDVYSNRDGFTGRDIETMGQQRLSPSNRTNSRTTGAAELISSGLESAFGPDGMLSLSPIQVDYLIGGYFGQVGAWAVAQTDVVKNVLSDVPKPERHWYEYQPIRRFYRNMGDPAPDKQMTMFYDALRESSRLYADLQQYRTEKNDSAAAELMSEESGVLQLRQRLARVSRKITALNARIKDVQARQNLSSEEKRRAIDVLKLRKNQLISVVIPAIEQVIERSRRV